MPVNSELMKLRQETGEFEDSLGYNISLRSIVRLPISNKQTITKNELRTYLSGRVLASNILGPDFNPQSSLMGIKI